MIAICLLCLAVVVAWLEYKWAEWGMEQLSCGAAYEEVLVEPGQEFEQEVWVDNEGRLPLLYVELQEYLPKEAVVRESEAWLQRYSEISMNARNLLWHTYLMPHTRFGAKVHLAFEKRGAYTLGRFCLQTGDFIGFRTLARMKSQSQTVVVMPARCSSPVLLKTLGGFLGDISVRRFMIEDPILITGFRDYTGREPMKSISWTQTAKANRMQVRQYDHTAEANVAVLLNLENSTGEEAEQCFEIARTVAEELEKKRIPYEFLANCDFQSRMGQAHLVAEGLGAAHLQSILYALGRSQGLLAFRFEKLVDRCVKDKRPNRSYILISPPLGEAQRSELLRLQKHSDYEICTLYAEGGAG